MLTILFDGIAYGMLLFVLACGLAVTLGPDELHQPGARRLRHGGRLRHGAADGALRRAVPRLPAGGLRRRRGARARARAHALPAACTAGRTSTRCCSRSAWCSWPWRRSTTSMGSSQQNIQLPAWLQGRAEIGSACRHRHYRSFIIVVCGALALGLQSSWRARASAAACAPRSTTRAWPRAWASTSTWCSLATFAVGSGLAGLGGALGAEVLGLDPTSR